MKSTLFITGTDTSVGKTFISALLLDFLLKNNLRAGYQKWVSTGDPESEPPTDLRYCLRAAGRIPDRTDLHLQVPCRFRLPASPHLAAEFENRQVEPAVIIDAYRKMAKRYDILIVEGVGGLLVPLRRDLLLADLLSRLPLATLVVARSGLGTLNHTFLTLEALKNRDIPVLGVVFSDALSRAEEAAPLLANRRKDTKTIEELLAADNIRTIAETGKTRVFGRLPRCRDLQEAATIFAPIGRAILEALAATSS